MTRKRAEHIDWLEREIEKSFGGDPYLTTSEMSEAISRSLGKAPRDVRSSFASEGLTTLIRRLVREKVDPEDGYRAYLHLSYQDEDGKRADVYGLVKNFKSVTDWERAKAEFDRQAYANMRMSNEIVRRGRARGFQLEFEFPGLEDEETA